MNLEFPDEVALYLVISKAGHPKSTAQVHMAACREAGVPEPHNHGFAGTFVRLERLEKRGWIQSSRVPNDHDDHETRVWYMPLNQTAGDEEKLYLVCTECGEAFDEMKIAFEHRDELGLEHTFRILTESEAM